MNRHPGEFKNSKTSLRLLAAMAIFAFAPLIVFAAAPSWWSNPNRPVIDSDIPNDYAAVNQGQVKNIAVKAVAEMNDSLAQFGGAGPALNNLAFTLSGTTPNTNDYAAVNLGQLKHVATPFLKRLLEIGYQARPLESGTYPWLSGSAGSANDYAMANIGQVKKLFSFDLTLSSDGSGIPDWWEHLYGITLGSGTTATSLAPRGDGLSYLDAYQQGLNPNDFYNGHSPSLAIVDGDNQSGAPGEFLRRPLIVLISDSNSIPLAHAPVKFTVTAGSGTLQAVKDGESGSALTVITNAYGRAIVYFEIASNVATDSQCQITCASIPSSYSVSGTFTEKADGEGGNSSSLPQGTEAPIPVQNYAAIDVSGSSTEGNDVGMIALDDSNNLAFAYTDSSGSNLQVYTWTNGTTAYNQTVTTGSEASTIQLGNDENGDDKGYIEQNCITTVRGLLPNGTVYGKLEAYGTWFNPSWSTYPFQSGDGVFYLGFTCTNGLINAIGRTYDYVSTDPINGPAAETLAALWRKGPYWRDWGFGEQSEYFILGADSDGHFFGQNDYVGFISPASGNSYFVSDDHPGTTPDGAHVFNGFPGFPTGMSENGCAIFGDDLYGFWQDDPGIEYGWWWTEPYAVWNGSSFVYLTDNPIAINKQGQVIGGDWLLQNGSSTPTPLKDLLPDDIKPYLSNISPWLLSNADSNGTVHIVFTATELESGSNNNYVLDINTSGSNAVAQMAAPDGVTYTTINAQGIMAGLQSVQTSNSSSSNMMRMMTSSSSSSSSKPVILPPVQFRLLSGHAGSITTDGHNFDGTVPTTISATSPDNTTTVADIGKTAANGGGGNDAIDVLGVDYPFGYGRPAYEGICYTYSLIVAAKVAPSTNFTYTWHRVYQDRSVTIAHITTSGRSYWFVKAHNSPTGVPTPIEDTDGGTHQTTIPSPKSILYCYDNPGMSVLQFAVDAPHVNDFAYEKTDFTYSVTTSSGTYSATSSVHVGQKIVAKRKAVGISGNINNEWTGVSNFVGTELNIDCTTVTTSEIRAIVERGDVGGTDPIVFDSSVPNSP